MNAFREHHQHSIRFHYRCFDRILLNGIIQPFQQEERVVGFFNTYRQLYPVSRDVLREIATQFHNWVKNRSQKWAAPILDAPQGRRDELVEPYFKGAKADAVVCILKAREPARIITAIGTKAENRWHLELKQRSQGQGQEGQAAEGAAQAGERRARRAAPAEPFQREGAPRCLSAADSRRCGPSGPAPSPSAWRAALAHDRRTGSTLAYQDRI